MDLVLVLLIIIMVLTPSLLKQLTATVPKKAEETASPVSDSAIVVEYTANRERTVNAEPVAPEALAEKLSERLRAARQKVVFFKAEDEAPYGEDGHLMDMARVAGAESVAVVTR